MGRQSVDRVAVVGGSVAGLAAAAALAPRAREVLLVERQRLADHDGVMTIAPQGWFPHVLLGGGAAALERLIPGLAAELFELGALGDFRGARHCHWWAAGAVRSQLPDLGPTPVCSRALLETALRRRVLGMPNVRVEDEVIVRGLRLDGSAVAGLAAERAGDPLTLDADLVVDASGRGSRSPAWLSQAGFPEPPTTRVEVGITYTAVDVRRLPSDLDGGMFAVVQNTPELARIGVALPTEGDGWKVLLGAYFGESAPTDPDGLRAFAASLPDPVIHRLLQNEWLSDPAQHRFPSSQRRHWERLRRFPRGFCVVGDAVASFNPLYGQGMSAAALQAEELARCIDRLGNSDRLPRAVAKATAKVVANPWQTATGADFIYPQTGGRRKPGTAAVNRYVARVMGAAAVDDVVNMAFTSVSQLLAPPSVLFRPSVVRRVRRATRGAPPLAPIETPTPEVSRP